MTGKVSFFRYVRHERVEEYQACGWKYEDSFEGTSHGEWAALMTWAGQGQPVEPRKQETTSETPPD